MAKPSAQTEVTASRYARYRARKLASGLCRQCMRPRPPKRQMCARCHKMALEAKQARKEKRIEQGLCILCGKPKGKRRLKLVHCNRCAELACARTTNHRERARAAALRHYGTACACCGESEPVFLTFDHVGGGGAAHRRKDLGARNMGAWLVRHNFPSGFRVLCWNCNLATRYGDPCPHSAGILGATKSFTPNTSWNQ